MNKIEKASFYAGLFVWLVLAMSACTFIYTGTNKDTQIDIQVHDKTEVIAD